MKRIAAIIVFMSLLLTALSGCSAKPEESAAAAPFDPSVWTNTDLAENVTADTPVNLKDDFGLAVNKDYLLGLEMPDGEGEVGGLKSTMYNNTQMMMALLTDDSLTGKDAEMVHAFYAMLTDWDKRNELGIEPVRKYLEYIDAISDIDGLTAYISDPHLCMAPDPLFMIGVVTDVNAPDRYTVAIYAPPLMLEDPAEYTGEMTETGELLSAEEEQCLTVVLKKFGYTDEQTADIIARSFAFETKLAEHMLTMEDSYQPDYLDRINNPVTMDELKEMAGSFPIESVLAGYGYEGSDTYNVTQPDYIASLAALYTEENLDEIKARFLTQTADFVYNLLDKDTRDEVTAISNSLYGVEGTKSEDQRAYEMINQWLPVPYDNLFIQKYLNEDIRDDIKGMIYDCIDTYRELLRGEEWLSEETRNKAIEKLDNMVIRAVYPDKLGDWSDLELGTEDENATIIDVLIKISDYCGKIAQARINTAKDRNEWNQFDMLASVPNAFYSPSENSINIFGGILNGVVYDANASREEKLASIGTIIGHEISHAFDPTGAQYDKDGALADWWTEEDWAAFEERSRKLIEYYDRIEPLEGVQYNGMMVQGEAIADIAGMKSALMTAAKEDGFDYDKFFRAFAKVWAVITIPSYEMYYAQMDEHPLSYLRTNVTVQQVEEFYITYDIKPGDGMYLAPEDRISVW